MRIDTSQSLENIISIDFFDFIKDNEILDCEFSRRLYYFKNLNSEKSFITIQNQLFKTIKKILNLTDVKEIMKLPEIFDEGCKLNRLKNKEKRFLTPVDLYKLLQEKGNYYTLDYYLISPELLGKEAIRDIYEQYKQINWFIFIALNRGILNENETISKKSSKIKKEYKSIWNDFDDKIYRIPEKLSVEKFREFFIYCIKHHPRVKYEEARDVFECYHEPKIEELKDICFVVIDDLIEFLDIKNNQSNKNAIEKLSNNEVAILKKMLDEINICFYHTTPSFREDYFEIERFGDIKKADIYKNLMRLDRDFEIIYFSEKNHNAVSIALRDKNNLSNFNEFKNSINKRYNSLDICKTDTSEDSKIVVDYNKFENRAKLVIGKFPKIEFSRNSALIINYLYQSTKLDKKYKSYKDFNNSCNTNIKSPDFRKRISKINRRVCEVTEQLIKEVIQLEDKTKSTQLNHYRWEIST